jgi:hypothetical protein
VAARPVANNKEGTPPSDGVPLGAQRGVPHCRSHPKQVVSALRELDTLYNNSQRKKRVEDVFNDELTQHFLTVYRAELGKIISSFKIAIAAAPAAVIGIASEEDDDDKHA